MSYLTHVAENRRLTILRLLEQQPDYSLNDAVIQLSLGPFAHNVSRDVVHTDLRWLEEQGLVTVDVVAGTCWVAKITTRGVDVALGRTVVPGVQRPSPRP
jgi:DeoR/GlpR family transcriptional regulator of sugar metabolism